MAGAYCMSMFVNLMFYNQLDILASEDLTMIYEMGFIATLLRNIGGVSKSF